MQETRHRDDEAGGPGEASRRGELTGHPVRERLGDVSRLDLGGVGERRDRPRHSGDAHATATRERQPVDRAGEELRGSVRPPRESCAQMLTRIDDSNAHGTGWLGR
jgi:hypothetical protein